MPFGHFRGEILFHGPAGVLNQMLDATQHMVNERPTKRQQEKTAKKRAKQTVHPFKISLIGRRRNSSFSVTRESGCCLQLP